MVGNSKTQVSHVHNKHELCVLFNLFFSFLVCLDSGCTLPMAASLLTGTVVAMEKEAGVLKPEHMTIIEATRDKVMASLSQYISLN